MSAASPDSSPESERAQPTLSWLALAIAALAAAVGAAVAPTPWPAGPGELRAVVDGVEVLRAPVEIGNGSPQSVEAPGASAELPAGISSAEPVLVRLALRGRTLATAGEASARIALVLPGGREELLPISSVDAAGRLVAKRRAPRGAAVMLGLLGLVFVLWVSEAVPLFATSLLIPVVLVVAGVATPARALAPFFHPLIALFFGTFLIAAAIRRVELDERIALQLVARYSRSPRGLFAVFMGVSAFLSMWMTNTGTTILLIPIALAVTEPLESIGYRKALVLGIAYAATTGGIGSVVGTPPNALAVDAVALFSGRQIGFVEWFGYGLPMVLLFLPAIGAYLWFRRGVVVDAARFAEVRVRARARRSELGPLDSASWTVIAVFAGVLALWLTSEWHGIHAGIVALAGALVLTGLGRVRESDLKHISWNSLITFGGGLTLGAFMELTGTADWMATGLSALAGLPGFVAITAVALATLLLTAFASNTASAALLIPVAMPLASLFGVEPTTLAVIVAIAASVDYAVVIGTPPTMIAYSTRLFTTREIFRVGIALDFVGIGLLVTAVLGIWKLLGLA